MTNSTELSRQDKIEYLELLEEKERRKKADPLRYAQQHDKQREATASMAAIRVLFWGNRVGKTEWGGQESSRYATANHPFRELKPPYEIWCACPSFDVQEHTTQKKLLSYIPESKIKRVEYLRGRIIKKMELESGITILFKSYEQGREKFQGAGVRLIWFDEEPPKDIWEECFVRVEAGQPLDVIMTMTPVKGMTWVYTEIYQKTGNPDLFVSEAGWDDNPYLTEGQKEQMSRGLTASAIQVRRLGKFVKRVGLVCNWWERSLHLRHYETLNRSWTWYEVLDGGWSDPAAWLLIGVDHDNSVHVVNGFRKKELMAEQIKTMRDARIAGLTITQGWTDNDNPRLVKQLENLKMYLTPVEKEPNESKNWDETLAEKLGEYGIVQPGTGLPRLFISDNLIDVDEKGNEYNWLVQEIENLTWLETASKQGEEIKPKWDDHRRYGHHFDGMRGLGYFLVSYSKPQKNQSRVYIPPQILRRKMQNRLT